MSLADRKSLLKSKVVKAMKTQKAVLKTEGLAKIREHNYDLKYAKHLVQSRKKTDSCLDGIRKNIYFLTRVRTKNEMINSQIKSQIERNLQEQEAIQKQPFVPVQETTGQLTESKSILKRCNTRGLLSSTEGGLSNVVGRSVEFSEQILSGDMGDLTHSKEYPV